MKKSSAAVLSIVLFGIGVIAAKPLNSLSQLFRGETSKNCVSERICVGSKDEVIFGLYELDKIGGLTSIFCGKPNDTGNIEYIFLSDILDGDKCERTQYSLDFRTNTTRTNITVKDNLIVKITQGPLHTLDP